MEQPFDPFYLRGLTGTRAIKAMLVAKGDNAGAAAFASGQNWGDTPGVLPAIRAAAVTADSTVDSGALLGGQVDGSDLIGLARPHEIVSRLLGARRVPFDVPLRQETGQASAYWVGEGKPAPLSQQAYAAVITLARRKVISISVITEELARSSAMNTESALSRVFAAGVIAAADQAFIDPTNAGSTAKPASVTYGAPSFVIGGASVANLDEGLLTLQTTLIDSGSTLEFAAYVIHPAVVARMALMRDASGALAYPVLNVRTGGFIGGIPVIASASAPRAGSPTSSSIVLLDAARIWVADAGELYFETSPHTSVEMLTNPTNDVMTPTATSHVSMMQTNSVAIRGTRILNFAAAAGAAAVLTGIAF